MKTPGPALGIMARNAGWLGLGEGFIKAALFLAAILVARGNGSDGLGTFSIAYSAAVIGVILLASGQQEVLVREVAREPDAAASLLRRARSIQNHTALLLLPAAAVGSVFLSSGTLRLCFLSFLPYAFFRSVLVLYGAAFKGLDRMDVEVRARGMEMLVVLALLSGVIFFRGPVWLTGPVFSTGALAGLLWIRAAGGKLGGTTTKEYSDTVDLAREGRPFLAMSILSQLLTRADTFLLAALAVSRKDIGLYAAASAPVWGILALPHLLAMAVYPSLSRNATGNGRPGKTAIFSLATAVFGGLVLAIVIYCLRDWILLVAFGPDFRTSGILLARLVWILPPATGMIFLGTILASWRRQNISLAVLFFLCVIFLLLNLFLIPRHGTMGATVAVLISQYSGFLLLGLATLFFMKKGETST